MSKNSGYSEFTCEMPQLRQWAEGIMVSRPRDFEIGHNYLKRWWVVPRNQFANVYLHEVTGPDDDRAMHDHPWMNTSVIISGGYIEHTPEGVFERHEGDVITRPAEALHRLELLPGVERTISLFFTGPRVREWGFMTDHGWVHYKEFIEIHGERSYVKEHAF
jgi:quercetin dioxygenase-like cupin family protein